MECSSSKGKLWLQQSRFIANAAAMFFVIAMHLSGTQLERALEAERLSNMDLQKSLANLRNKPAGPSDWRPLIHK